MPRFELTTSYDLVKPLTRLGMARAFAPPGPAGADFSGMCASDDPALQLFIQFVLHKAVVQVHEKGTVAAAATAVMMGVPGGSTPFTPKFVADHPFLFLICHRPSGSILFLGRLAEPEGAGATAP